MWVEERGRGPQGVAIGVVISNALDSAGRIEIALPTFAGKGTVYRARLAAPMTGNDRGLFFLPEKDDEVLVAFEGGDLNRPCVIGALWSSRDLPPSTKPDQRMMKSRTGHIIRLDDTGGKEKIEIIDKSGNNLIAIDTATGTITIKAKKVVIDSADIRLGSAGASELLVLGDKFRDLYNTHTNPQGAAPPVQMQRGMHQSAKVKTD